MSPQQATGHEVEAREPGQEMEDPFEPRAAREVARWRTGVAVHTVLRHTPWLLRDPTPGSGDALLGMFLLSSP